MSLIKIRGITILSPILTEKERIEARAFRDKAVLHQRRLEQQRTQQLEQCNYQYQQQQSNINYQQQTRTSNICMPGEGDTDKIDNERLSKRTNKNLNKDDIRQPIPAGIKSHSCGETSSSSAPSSQGSGGELTSGLEDSPSAANVSVQTESSGSVTTSTDLHHYLNNSLDTSLDTSISVSHDIWRNSPSLMEVDEALLRSESTEVATSLILGRLHPSVILNSSFKPKASRQESQTTETTSSTLVHGQLSSGMHTISEGQDTATVGSVSLSFASVSEEGSEEGLEVLEVSEELLDISEEDRDASFPSELDSDAQKYDKDDCQDNSSSRTKSTSGVDTDEGFPSTKEKWKDNVVSQQRDSGRGTSHSDYLDNYLDLLTNRSGSSLSFHPGGSCVSKCESTIPATTVSAVSGISSSKVTDSFTPTPRIVSSTTKAIIKPRLVCSEESLEKICPASKQIIQKDLALKKLKSTAQKTETPKEEEIERDDDSITDEIEAFDRIDEWQKELLSKPRASSATPERKERRRSRSRRWSSCQPLDPRRSVGSKYLDSYLGKLTDDAWLQYPTLLSERRMVYLSSDEYINAVRPKPIQRSLYQQFTSTDMSENSASEETKNFHTSTESLHSSIPDGGIKENLTDGNSGISVGEGSVAKHEADKQATEKDREVKCETDDSSVPQGTDSSSFDGDFSPKLEATSISGDANKKVHQLKEKDDNAVSPSQSSLGNKMVSKVNVDRQHPESFDQLRDSKSNLERDVSVESDKEQAEKLSGGFSIRITNENDVRDDEAQKVNTVSSRVYAESHESVTTCLGNGVVSDEDKYLKAPKAEYRPKTEPRSVETTPNTETNDDGQESYSDDSSETEPSTIVYLEDIPLESPSEGKSLISTDSEEHSFIKAEKGVSLDKGENGVSSVVMNGQKSYRKETATSVPKLTETVTSTINDQSHLTNHSIKLVTTQKTDKFMSEKLSNGDSAPLKLISRKTNIFESDVDESEEECLVVQVIVDENGSNENQKSICGIAKLETKKKNELSNDNIARKELITVANIADSEMELAQGSPVNSWELTPEQGAKDAMGQVLSLLKAKQDQELEELRMRQEAEIHQVIEKLQKVSPQQLHAFLSASNDSEVIVLPKSRSSPQNVDQIPSSNSADGHSRSESLEARRIVKSISPKRNVDTKKRNSPDEASRMRAMRDMHEDEVQSTVPCIVYPMATSTDSMWSSSHSHLSECTGHPPTCSAMSVKDYSTCISDATYSTSSLPLMSEDASSATHVTIMSGSCSSITGSLVESPKPRPSNHTNIMPSYFMYDENRISSEVQKDDNYRAHIAEQNSTFVESITRPQNVPPVSSSFGNSDHNAVGCSAHVRNNNPETVDTMSYINGNCLSYGDGMQYYRLFTGDEDNSTTKTTSHNTQIVSYPPQSTDTVVQPGLFRVIGNSPRPTSITSLLKEHPEMFGEVLEVNLEQDGEWTSTEADLREHHAHSRERHSHPISHGGTVYIHPPNTTTSTSSIVAEGGLDMVPERENAAAPSHHLSENQIFIRGIIRLQACVRRFLTRRLLRTKFVQEQLATLSEIAKLAQQFHRDILTDNIQKGDVDFHKTLYNQERLARDRIRRVFVVLTVEEQMALIHRDRQLWKLQQEKKRGSDPGVSPVHTRTRSRYQEDREKLTVPARTSTKRTSPQGSRNQQDRKTRTSGTGATKAINTPLVQPTLVQPPQSVSQARSARSDYRMSPRGSRLPVHVARSSSNLDSGTQSSYRSSVRTTRSPSQESQSSIQSGTNRSGSHTSRSNSTSRFCGRTGTQPSSRVTNHMTSTRTCTIRNSTNRVTPPRTAAKTSVVSRRPWR
ncbi:mucin-4-like isoform X2 [Palaemon carinicauda]|uniref:mucin-4-like isoform X2 n=1 Tax=Palaemon carinicauda TaxID=392227 RepID=UPI0035B5ED57